MFRYILLGTIAFAGLACLDPLPALAQDTGQTDQSEEDWRKSQRKRKTDIGDFDPISNPGGIGSGINLPPLDPIDTLPEESQRHLRRQRAKVIAEMEFGETPGDVPFEPSEAAKDDPNLAAEEEEAWEVILTDLQGGSGGGDQSGEGGPNKVAVAGQGGADSRSVTRGGSAQSVSDILAQLKGLQAGNGRAASSGDGLRTQPQSTQTCGTSSAGGAGDVGQPGGELAAEANSPAQDTDPAGAEGQPNGQGQQADGTGQAGSGSSDSQSQAGQTGQGQDGSDSGAGDNGADGAGGGADVNARVQTSPNVDPLILPDRPSSLGNEAGTTSSASDYLKGITGRQTPGKDEDEE